MNKDKDNALIIPRITVWTFTESY